jgi:glycosyltransferase involved in cell wall biosynthesis
MNKKIVISVNTAWNVCNFRAGLVKALVRQGYEVLVMAGDDEYSPHLAPLGCHFKKLPMDHHGTDASRDLALLVKYWRVLQSVQPLAYLGFTIKPNVYGSIAASGLGIPVINNVAGLGATFLHSTMLTKVVKQLYRLSLRRSSRVFFQNRDDRKLFLDARLVKESVTEVLPGSGINLRHFHPLPVPALDQRRFRFLLVSRMLKDKGIEEYVAAARIVHRYFPSVQFQLLGGIDPTNPNAVPAERIREWEAAGVVQYLNRADDVRPYLGAADCIVLPSYREGVPHSLLEAAATARPIIATDVAGCRDIVDDNGNGFLCRVKNAADLADKMIQMVRMDPEQRLRMGQAGRRKVVREFDENIVIHRYLKAIRQVEEANVLPVPASAQARRVAEPNTMPE